MDINKTINTKYLEECFRLVDTLELGSSKDYKQTVNLFVLNNVNDKFDYQCLKSLIRNNLANYVFNRRKIDDYIKDGTVVESGFDARDKLVEISENALDKENFGAGGELGEILLYIFLEGFCGSKKLLSKVEIKTNNKDYVKGFDGVHFNIKKTLDGEVYQIIFGESKIVTNLNKAISEAFDSLIGCYENKATEFSLLDESIMNEFAVDNETVEMLKKILIPKYQSANCLCEVEHAFGIFIGYTIQYSEDNRNLHKKAMIDTQIKSDIEKVKVVIANKIAKTYHGNNSDYYIYIMPFNDAKVDKKEIMEYIAGRRMN